MRRQEARAPCATARNFDKNTICRVESAPGAVRRFSCLFAGLHQPDVGLSPQTTTSPLSWTWPHRRRDRQFDSYPVEAGTDRSGRRVSPNREAGDRRQAPETMRRCARACTCQTLPSPSHPRPGKPEPPHSPCPKRTDRLLRRARSEELTRPPSAGLRLLPASGPDSVSPFRSWCRPRQKISRGSIHGGPRRQDCRSPGCAP